ncbi:unnamed protein product [Owenia fusiformis]|uniref:BPL/LPL catalytic domain-containing protein n=1 Tax=Owenia fusiformis TaxID=6347 RepID=A0A8S4N1J6_OWEFU|nr:unnamed protein product [Owenia fusiformis]
MMTSLMTQARLLQKYSKCFRDIPQHYVRNVTRTLATHSTTYKALVSKSTNIHKNLAFEQYLYSTIDFHHTNLLFLWRNDPCVVIGRHQNPWVECNIGFLQEHNIALARRHSGGGTVYHDNGNLNCTFFTARNGYNRKRNLNLLVEAITKSWDIDLTVNERDDIILDGLYKISGTAAKLDKTKGYHHCTLLFNVQADTLQEALSATHIGCKSKATASFPARIANLADADNTITYEALIASVAEQFLAQNRENQVYSAEWVDPGSIEGCKDINKIQEDLQKWEWVFGKTPPFHIHRQFRKDFKGYSSHVQIHLDIKAEIVCGLVEKIQINMKGFDSKNIEEFIRVLHQECIGLQFRKHTLEYKLNELLNTSHMYDADMEIGNWIMSCILDNVQ